MSFPYLRILDNLARRPCRGVAILLAIFASMTWLATRQLQAADFAEARAAFYSGDYETCIELTKAEVERGVWNDFWSRLLVESLMTTGRYTEARNVYETVASKFSNSIPLRVLAADAYRFSGDGDKGNQLLAEIPELVKRRAALFRPRKYVSHRALPTGRRRRCADGAQCVLRFCAEK
ncbi:MAG: tetratricopeptide repeat protein [Pirellulaceae bacterium]